MAGLFGEAAPMSASAAQILRHMPTTGFGMSGRSRSLMGTTGFGRPLPELNAESWDLPAGRRP